MCTCDTCIKCTPTYFGFVSLLPWFVGNVVVDCRQASRWRCFSMQWHHLTVCIFRILISLKMTAISENGILSRLELVLPRHVIETCYLLPTGVGTEFLSSNICKATMTRTNVFKAEDQSVKIEITGNKPR